MVVVLNCVRVQVCVRVVCARGVGSLGHCAQCLVAEVENLGQVWAFLHDQDLFAPVGDSLVDVRCARLTNGKRECSTWHIAAATDAFSCARPE